VPRRSRDPPDKVGFIPHWRLVPPLTQEEVPLAVLSASPLIAAKIPLALLICPPLVEKQVPLASLRLPPLATATSPLIGSKSPTIDPRKREKSCRCPVTTLCELVRMLSSIYLIAISSL
jgi:hypothetical protein